MKLSIATYETLTAALCAIALLACARTGKGEIECSQEQRQRLLSASVECRQADTSRLVPIDVSDILDARFDFTEIVRDLRFIPLETTRESRLGSVRRLTFTEDNILVSDDKGVKVFNSEGGFVGCIPFGPSSKNDFALDLPNGEILLYTQGSIGHYGMDCKRRWVESIPLNFSAMTNTASGDNLVMFFGPDDANPGIGGLDSVQFLVMDRKGALVARPDVPAAFGRPAREGVALPSSGGGMVLCCGGCDTIFAFSDSSFSARYSLCYDSAKRARPQADLNTFFFAGNAQMTTDGVFFKIQNRRANTVFAFYDARTGRLRGGIPDFDYRLLPPIYNPIATCGDSYAAIFNTYLTEDDGRYTFTGDIVPAEAKALLRGVRHDDNPVIALYRVHID